MGCGSGETETGATNSAEAASLEAASLEAPSEDELIVGKSFQFHSCNFIRNSHSTKEVDLRRDQNYEHTPLALAWQDTITLLFLFANAASMLHPRIATGQKGSFAMKQSLV
jgi:hypothetical protein